MSFSPGTCFIGSQWSYRYLYSFILLDTSTVSVIRPYASLSFLSSGFAFIVYIDTLSESECTGGYRVSLRQFTHPSCPHSTSSSSSLSRSPCSRLHSFTFRIYHTSEVSLPTAKQSHCLILVVFLH